VEPFVLEAVLRRLGPPTQWLPPGRVPVTAQASAAFTTLGQYLKARYRGCRDALVRGPEDWRLAYLSFGVFALGVVAFPLFPLFLAVSYLLSRAGIAAAADGGVSLDPGRKWLLYPPVVVVSLSLLIAVVGAPVGIVAGSVDEIERIDRYERQEMIRKHPANPWRGDLPGGRRALRERFPDAETRLDRLLAAFPGPTAARPVAADGFFAIGVLSAWWAVVAGVAGALPGFARAAVFPFAQRFPGRRAGWVGTACLALLAAWLAAAYHVAELAGLV
jgi:hypothetical protein